MRVSKVNLVGAVFFGVFSFATLGGGCELVSNVDRSGIPNAGGGTATGTGGTGATGSGPGPASGPGGSGTAGGMGGAGGVGGTGGVAGSGGVGGTGGVAGSGGVGGTGGMTTSAGGMTTSTVASSSVSSTASSSSVTASSSSGGTTCMCLGGQDEKGNYNTNNPGTLQPYCGLEICASDGVTQFQCNSLGWQQLGTQCIPNACMMCNSVKDELGQMVLQSDTYCDLTICFQSDNHLHTCGVTGWSGPGAVCP